MSAEVKTMVRIVSGQSRSGGPAADLLLQFCLKVLIRCASLTHEGNQQMFVWVSFSFRSLIGQKHSDLFFLIFFSAQLNNCVLQ